jgi:hypothetical protein
MLLSRSSLRSSIETPEVNSSRGFTVYQQATGRMIAEAIADLLAVGRRFAGSMRLDRFA